MRIAIVSGDDVAGDDYLQHSAALAANVHEVTTHVRQRDRRRSLKGFDHGVRLVPAYVGPKAVRSAHEALPFVGEWALALGRAWSAGRPDVVHAHGWLGGLAAQLAGRRHGIPVVQSFQGLAAARRPSAAGAPDAERARVEPLLARNAAWVTAESSADLDELARLRHGRSRSSVLAGGVDGDVFTPVGPAAARSPLFRILCLAPNPLPSNGLDVAISAIEHIPAAELLIAEIDATDEGHSGARDDLKRLAAERGVAERVQFLDNVGGDKLPKLLRSVDVLVCTPREPQRAATVLQAMSSGLAVVALPVGVLADAVVDAVTGVLLSTNRHAELVTALRSLQTQSFLRQSMGSAGRSRALSRFTWARAAQESLTIYRQLAPCPKVETRQHV